jgi:uncharacterized protein (DUF1697 family)
MKYVALLRGINVGGNNTVLMSELKLLFEELGFTEVRTYINSGNVIFKGKASLLKKVEPAFAMQFGFPIKFLFVEEKKLQKIHDSIPAVWTNDADKRTDVWFLWDEFANKSSLDLLSIRKGIDSVLYVDGAIIWHVLKKNITKSGMNKVIGTKLYKNQTTRNANTVRKLVELVSM